MNLAAFWLLAIYLLSSSNALAAPLRRPMVLEDCLNALSIRDRVQLTQTHAAYQRGIDPNANVRQIKNWVGEIKDPRARQTLLHQIFRDHPQLKLNAVRALIEQNFKSSTDRAEALYGWFLISRSKLTVQSFVPLVQWLRELVRPNTGFFASTAAVAPFSLPDLLTLYLEKLNRLERPGVEDLVKLYPERADEVWAHYLVRLQFLNLDQLPHSFSAAGYLRLLLTLIETRPSAVATSIDELIERARKTSRPDLVGQAYLIHAPRPFSAPDFVRLVRLAYPDLLMARDEIDRYLQESGEALSDINKISLLELVAVDPGHSVQLHEAFARLWAQRIKPAQIIGSVSALTARAARIHFAETNSPSWELPRLFRYAGKLVAGEKLRGLVCANLARRYENLTEDELALILAQPDLGADFLLSPEVTRLLTEWPAEGLSHWVKDAKGLSRADRRRLYLALVGKAITVHPGEVNWKDLGSDIKALVGQNLSALALINTLVEASLGDRAQRRLVKFELIVNALSPDGWNLALLNLVAGEADGLDGPALAEILQTMVRPRKDEVAAVLTAYLQSRPRAEIATNVTWPDVDHFAEALAQSPTRSLVDHNVSVYLNQITPDADRERAIFGVQHGNGPPRSGVIERDRIWLERVSMFAEPGRSLTDLSEALTRLHNQAVALKYLVRRIDRGALRVEDALIIMRALIPGDLKLAFLRAYFLSDHGQPSGSLHALVDELPSTSRYDGQILLSQVTPLIAESDPTSLIERLHAMPSESIKLELAEKSLNKFYGSWEIRDVLRVQAALSEEKSRRTFLLRYVELRLPENPAALAAQLNELLRDQVRGSSDDLIEAIMDRAVFAAHYGGPAPKDVFRSIAARMKSRERREQVHARLSGAT